jgi:uncharacterized membrane protein
MEFRDERPLISGWDGLALAGLVALAGYYEYLRPLLPDPVPVHFDAMGRANGWAPKAGLPWLLFGAPLLVWAVFLGVEAAGRLVPRGPGISAQPLRGLLVFGLCLLMGACATVPLSGAPVLFAGLGALAACVVLGVVLLVRDSLRAVAEFRESSGASGAEPDARHYRGGLFYVNPDDPRVWVEKRVGTGWTLNFARPASFLILLLLLIPVVIAVRLGIARH